MQYYTQICLFLLLGATYSVCAQDFHFSNTSATRSFSNFAAATTSEDYQVTLAYRQQYTTVPVGYKTSAANLIAKLPKFTTGFAILSDRAGDASYQTTRLQLPFSKRYLLTSNWNLGFFLTPGISFMNYNASALTFNSQFTGDQFTSSNPSGETFSSQNTMYFHSDFGMTSQYNVNEKVSLVGGYSITLFGTPKKFQVNTVSKNSNRHQLFAKSSYLLTNNQSVFFEVNVSAQKKYNQILLLAQYFYKFNSTKMVQHVNLGIGLRARDALIITAGTKMKDVQVDLAYDLTTSSFAKATNHQGATELIVSYHFYKKFRPKFLKPACPVFL